MKPSRSLGGSSTARNGVRCLVLMLVLVFSVATMPHATHTEASAAAPHSHDLVASPAAQDGSDEPCGFKVGGQLHSPLCGMGAGCSLCVPIIVDVTEYRTGMLKNRPLPEASRAGGLTSSHFRPPKRAPRI